MAIRGMDGWRYRGMAISVTAADLRTEYNSG